MKIRLITDVPVGEEHGMTAGREFETIEGPLGMKGIWVMGDADEPVRLHPREYELVEE